MMDSLSQSLGENYIAYDICYSQTGLLSYRIDELKDLSSLVRELEASAALSREMKKLSKLARGEEPPRKRKRQRAAAPAGSRAPRKKADNDEDKPEKPENADKDEGESSSASSSSSSSTSSDGPDDVAPEGAAGDVAAEAAAGAAEAAAGAEGPPPLPPAPPLGPTYDPAIGRAHGPGGQYWGRVTVIRPGQISEAISVYCGRHGCSVVKRVTASPGQDEILAWFVAGQSVPAGRTSTLQSHHKQLWPR